MEEIILRELKEEDIPSVVDIQINSWKTAYRGIIDDSYLDTMNRDKIIGSRNREFSDQDSLVG